MDILQNDTHTKIAENFLQKFSAIFVNVFIFAVYKTN